MHACLRLPRRFRCFLLAALVASGAAGPSRAYDPEIGTSIASFPIVRANGEPFEWRPDGARYRILVVGATWCPPCQDLKAALPHEIARLRQAGISVSTIFVEADEFQGVPAGARRVPGTAAENRWGYVDAAPDPTRIDLKKESPKGVRDWGAFRASGYPTTILLDERNVVLERYRGGTTSLGVFSDIASLARRNGGAASVVALKPAPTRAESPAEVASPPPTRDPVGRAAVSDPAGDDLIGLWRINNPEARDPRPLFLRVIGATADAPGSVALEASLSFKLTQWVPVEARCDAAPGHCVVRVTTGKQGRLTAHRRPDGTYVGSIAYGSSRRPLVRPITLEPMSLDDAEL